MDIAKIRKLIKLINASDITEIEVTEGEQSVRIRRGIGADVHPHAIQTAPHHVAPSPFHATMSPPAMVAVAESNELAEATPASDEHVVSSPMVGTFYTASSPDSAPFVREGDRVQKGDTICIIEAMKLMNAIEAEYDGVVQSILLENATPVEFGQSMFEIVPS